MKIIINLYNSL